MPMAVLCSNARLLHNFPTRGQVLPAPITKSKDSLRCEGQRVMPHLSTAGSAAHTSPVDSLPKDFYAREKQVPLFHLRKTGPELLIGHGQVSVARVEAFLHSPLCHRTRTCGSSDDVVREKNSGPSRSSPAPLP